MSMFCRQCEQTAQGKGCTIAGVCGKNETVATLQDALIHALKSIAVYAKIARDNGKKDAAIDRFIIEGLFTTVTNVNFDEKRIVELIRKAGTVKETATRLAASSGKLPTQLPAAAQWAIPQTQEDMLAAAKKAGHPAANANEDIRSLRELILYGIKGVAAYADHAAILGKEDEKVNAFFSTALSAIADDTLSAETLTALAMETGKVNLRCMELLDAANTSVFGHPVPTQVTLGVKKGPAIIVTGHDLEDLRQLLEQTTGTGVNIYTHGEMLPTHGYPGIKKYPHLAGHFGSAWQNQQKEFAGVPAGLLFTTNCIQRPLDSYNDRVFTTGLVAWPGMTHIASADGRKDFSPVIKKALELKGFPADNIEKTITVGFGHNAILGVADKVIDAVKSGALKHIYLIGGCDGAKPGRNYYTEFAEKTPKDTVILTLACGKFRINRLDLGTLGPLPRLIDVGQCNDAYSAIKVAAALAEAFKTDVNGLPLSIILSWYEQKAVAILLTLLSLGIKNMRLGPTLPAFVSPAVLNLLVEKFGIQPITTPEKDIPATLS